MHGPANYAHEKLMRAVHLLAVGEGDVRSRLRSAMAEMDHLDEQHFPEHLRADYRSIQSALTKRGPSPDGTKGAYDHTLDRMVNRTGAKIAMELCTLYEKLGEYLREQTESPDQSSQG
jgi:hypothetical protein